MGRDMVSGAAVSEGSGRLAAALLACLALGACGVQRALNPAEIYREVSGANDAKRPTPPGLDQPFPSLHTVPPRPERPSPEAREAITAALAADRGRSREPLTLRETSGGGEAPAPGMAPAPPPRPSLAAAPRIPWTETDPSPASPPASRPAAPAPAGAPEVPDAAPEPPPSNLLGGPPPPPAPELMGAPPPTRR